MHKRYAALIFLVCAVGSAAWAQFSYKLDVASSRENFRTAIEAYQRGRYAQALMLFEKTLSSSPSDSLTLYWLGKTYRQLGLDPAAIALWEKTLASGDPVPFVSARMELAAALMDDTGQSVADKYIAVRETPGTLKKEIRFKRPSWIQALPDGGLLLVSHGSNQVLRINANGSIIERMSGGATGFDRPFGCVYLPNGNLAVSEFQADRIAIVSPAGIVTGYWGEAKGPGRLIGPQYLAVDADGYLYVSEAGLTRVVKLDPNGKFVTSFTGKSDGFSGLRMPTGIAIDGERLYVADAILKTILVFDLYGNLLDTVLQERFIRPESVQVYKGKLLVADTARIVYVDPETDALVELYRAPAKGARLTTATFDQNGDLWVPDFDNSMLLTLADPVASYSGLFVEAERVYTDKFPRVSVDVRVRDKYGRPVVGLSEMNFYLSETSRHIERTVENEKSVDRIFELVKPVQDFSFDGLLDATTRIEMSVLVEASVFMMQKKLEVRDALGELYGLLDSDSNTRLIIASAAPQPAVRGSIKTITSSILDMKGSASWRFDSGLRLAAGELFGTSGRRAITFISSGDLNEDMLQGASLAELASMLTNNRISLHLLHIGKNPISPALQYLMTKTGGTLRRTDAPEGIGDLAMTLRSSSTGVYRVSYTSASDAGFGQRYLPMAVEVYLRDRSGREESGYFAPLQ